MSLATPAAVSTATPHRALRYLRGEPEARTSALCRRIDQAATAGKSALFLSWKESSAVLHARLGDLIDLDVLALGNEELREVWNLPEFLLHALNAEFHLVVVDDLHSASAAGVPVEKLVNQWLRPYTLQGADVLVATSDPSPVTLPQLQQQWPALMDCVREQSRVNWAMLTGSVPANIDGDKLTVRLDNENMVRTCEARAVDRALERLLHDQWQWAAEVILRADRTQP